MATSVYKKYLLIDHANNRHRFINSTSELPAWFNSLGVNMSTIPTTGNSGVPTNLVLLDLRTGEQVPIKLVIGTAAIVIS